MDMPQKETETCPWDRYLAELEVWQMRASLIRKATAHSGGHQEWVRYIASLHRAVDDLSVALAKKDKAWTANEESR